MRSIIYNNNNNHHSCIEHVIASEAAHAVSALGCIEQHTICDVSVSVRSTGESDSSSGSCGQIDYLDRSGSTEGKVIGLGMGDPEAVPSEGASMIGVIGEGGSKKGQCTLYLPFSNYLDAVLCYLKFLVHMIVSS